LRQTFFLRKKRTWPRYLFWSAPQSLWLSLSFRLQSLPLQSPFAFCLENKKTNR